MRVWKTTYQSSGELDDVFDRLVRTNIAPGSGHPNLGINMATDTHSCYCQRVDRNLHRKHHPAMGISTRVNSYSGAPASAVATPPGASATAAYDSGVAVFTHASGGLMFEGSVGGQRFKYTPKEN
jgi:hypothetical protein